MLWSVSLPQSGTGLVVRPAAATGDNAASSSAHQTLVFSADGVRTLEGGSEGEPLKLGLLLPLTGGASPGSTYAMRDAGHAAVFEPASGCVFFAECNTVMRLDGGNVVTLVAGSRDEQLASVDGAGEAARFSSIMALAADGRGAVFVAELGCIRKLSFNGAGGNAASERTAAVTTLPSSAPPVHAWLALSYRAAGGVLLAATPYAVYAISVPESGSPGGPPQLLAGDPAVPGGADGCGAAARFNYIHSMLAGAGGCVYIGDHTHLRKLDVAQRTVSTMQACSWQVDYPPSSLAILPSGHMVCASRSSADLQVLAGNFAFSGLLPKAHASGQQAAEELVKHLLASVPAFAPASDGTGGSGGLAAAPRRSKRGRGSSDASSTCGDGDNSGVFVTVRLGDKAFVAHYSLLADRSDFFRQLFEGGFADSGAAEVALPDADPDAFGLLLAYMYRGVLVVPRNLLRPAAELAGRLLMPTACSELAARLMAGCTPASAVPDLLWAEKHSMGELVAQLKAYFVRHAKEVTAATPRSTLAELAATCPDMIAELVAAALGAPAV